MKTFLVLPITILLLFFHTQVIAQTCIVTCPENIVVKADSGKGGTYVNLPVVLFVVFPAASVQVTDII